MAAIPAFVAPGTAPAWLDPLLFTFAEDPETDDSWLLTTCPVVTVFEEGVKEGEDDEVKEDEEVDSPLLVSRTLVGGEGVIGGSSPSSRGFMGGVLSSPLCMNLPGDNARSSSRSSGLLIDRPLNDRRPRVLGEQSTLLLFGSGVLKPLPPDNDIDPGGVLLFLSLLLLLLLAIATGCGGDFIQVGVFSALLGSVLIATDAEEFSGVSWCPLVFKYPANWLLWRRCGLEFASGRPLLLLLHASSNVETSFLGVEPGWYFSGGGVSGSPGDCLMLNVSWKESAEREGKNEDLIM